MDIVTEIMCIYLLSFLKQYYLFLKSNNFIPQIFKNVALKEYMLCLWCTCVIFVYLKTLAQGIKGYSSPDMQHYARVTWDRSAVKNLWLEFMLLSIGISLYRDIIHTYSDIRY